MLQATLALVLFLPIAAQAITFTAVQRLSDGAFYEPQRFRSDSILTVTVDADNPEAVIRFPSRILDRYAWPPLVAVTLNGAEARDGDCDLTKYGLSPQDDPHFRYCIGKLEVTILGDGEAEIRVPRAWFLDTASLPYRIHNRYQTCLETNGATDTENPGNRCPPLGSFSWSFHRTSVSRPLTAWLGQIQHGKHPWTEEFIFLPQEGYPPFLDPEWPPDPSHYGELERVYAWVESQTADESPDDNSDPDAPRVSHVLTHVFAGPLATSTAETEITITNPTQEPCSASVLFHRGMKEAPAVRFNGELLDDNLLAIDIAAGEVQRIVLTADPGQVLAVGAVYVEQEPGCVAGDLQVEARYLITGQDGQIMEAFSVLPQTENDWLSDGDCRLLSNSFGGQDNIGLAMVTARTGEAAPSGTRMTFEAYDWQGNFVEEPPGLEVTGEQQALNPWKFDGPRLIKLCLDVPDGQPVDFRLSLISIAARVSSRNVQYSSSTLIRP